MLVSASDEELIEKIVAVRGLGRWSVEMFACFGLKRMDVFSTGDLGVQYVLSFFYPLPFTVTNLCAKAFFFFLSSIFQHVRKSRLIRGFVDAVWPFTLVVT